MGFRKGEALPEPPQVEKAASMQPNEDERVLAAIAHASIIANIINLAGMIAATLIWTTQRERSRYVGAHALQSLAYQGVVLVIATFLAFTWGLCLGISLLPAILRPDLYQDHAVPDSFWLAMAGLIVPIGFSILAAIYGIYGSVQAYRGRPFRYPLVGRLVRKDLEASVAMPPAREVPPAAGAVPVALPEPVAVVVSPAPAEGDITEH